MADGRTTVVQRGVMVLASLFLLGLLWVALSPVPAPVSTPTPTAVLEVRPPATPTPRRPATPGPFPAADPPEVVVDMVGGVRATVRRGGLVLTIALPYTLVVPGEALLLEMELRNEGSEIITPMMFNSALVDGAGEYAVEGITRLKSNMALPFWASIFSERTLTPGETLVKTLVIQLPTEPVSTTYSLWGSASFHRAADSGSGWPYQMDAGPIVLSVAPAAGARQLSAELSMTEEGWSLTATASDGSHPSTFWGWFEGAHFEGGLIERFLPSQSMGTWSAQWVEHAQVVPEAMLAVVGAPGHSAAVVTATLGTVPEREQVPSYQETVVQSREEAQALVPFQLRVPVGLPLGSQLVDITVMTTSYPQTTAAGGTELLTSYYVRESHQLAGGHRLSFSQWLVVGGERDPAASPSIPRDAQLVSLPTFAGYSQRRFDICSVTGEHEDGTSYSVSALCSELSQESLTTILASTVE